MQPSQRILINTLAQYIRTIVNLLLSLYSSRLVLNVLGVEDYGIYSLVAGVVSMLSFLTNSLVGSTQRFLSVSQGKGDSEHLKQVFGNSLVLHLLIGAVVLLVMECLRPFLFDGFLNIPSDRIDVSKILYQQVIFMVYISFVASPYKALLISRENIVYASIVDVLDGILKVVLVIFLQYVTIDKLLGYGWVLFAIQCFNLLVYLIYSHVKYEECSLPRLNSFNLQYIKEFSQYTGWVVYSTAVIAFRNQGMAIILNRVMGPIINAAYGIGMQLSGMVAFVSTSFNNAIAPQLMASEGRGDRDHMWLLSMINSKFSFLLLAMIGIPTIFEMPELLRLWLGNVPENTICFGRTFLLMQIVDLLSGGLGLANRAMGNIGKYTLVTYSPKLLIIPFSWFALKMGSSLISVCAIMIFFETLCMLLRIYLLRNEEGFEMKMYCRDVILRSIIPCVFSSIICYMFSFVMNFRFRFVLTYVASIVVFVIITYFTSLTNKERSKLDLFLGRTLNRIIN